jgi:hypothetical protein
LEPCPERHHGKTATSGKTAIQPEAWLKTARQIGFRPLVEKEAEASGAEKTPTWEALVLHVHPRIHRRFGDGRNGMAGSRFCQGAKEFFDFLIVLIGQPLQALCKISIIAPVWHLFFLPEGARASDRSLIKANSTLKRLALRPYG